MRSSPTTSKPRSNGWVRVATWILVLSGGLLVVSLAGVAGLVLALAMTRTGPGSPVTATVEMPVQPAPPSDEVARVVLRERALKAIREGDYDRAVALTTEAVAIGPGEDDLQELLAIAIELSERKKRSVAQAPAVGEPDPPPPAPRVAAAIERPVPRRVEAPAAVAPEPSPRPPEPAAAPVGIAVITSSPKGATFEIPGLLRGQTPFRALDLPAGSHQVVFYVDDREVRTARLEVPAGGVEILNVDLAPDPSPPSDPSSPSGPAVADADLATPPPRPAPTGDGTLVYVFVPNSVKPRPLQDAFTSGLPGMTVTAFGSFRELQAALGTTPPHAVVAPRTVLDALGLPVHLQGRDASGAADERYVLLSTRTLTAEELGGAVIGTVDVAGRDGSAAFVADLVGTAEADVKRVAEGDDLLALLQFGNADAVVLPETAARKLLASTQMRLTETPIGAGGGLPALSVLEPSRRSQVEGAVRGLGSNLNTKVGVDKWGPAEGSAGRSP